MTRSTLLPRLLKFVLIATWLGLLTGLLEVAIVVFRKDLLHDTLRIGAHMVWMAPLGDAIAFALAGAATVLATWLFQRWLRPLPAFRVFAFVIALAIGVTLVLWTPWLSEGPGLVLGAGIAWQLARLARNGEASWLALARRWVLPTAALIAVLGVGSAAWFRWSEQRRIAALPEPPAGAPNILLLVMDTVGAEWLSLYGYPRPTSPRLEALARSGVVFEQVYATASWTLPSHATMFTGHYGSELSADWMVPLDRRFPTLAERLTSLGYVTGGFTANQAFGDPVFGLSRGFLRYETYPDSWEEVLQNFAIGLRLTHSYQVRRLFGYWNILNRKNAARVNQEFLQWSRHAGRRPFFAFLNYFDTHEPYYPPAPFDSLFGKGLDVLPPGTRIESRDVRVPLKVYRELPSRAVRQLRDAYDGCLAYVDEQIGRVLEELKRRGLLDNTIVIVTADHGEMRGEAERFGHGFDVHAPVLHVPLIVRYPPRVPPGLRVDGAVSLRDLAATIADLSRLGSRLGLPGSSLLPADGPNSVAAAGSPVVSSLDHPGDGTPATRSIILGRDHYIQYRDGHEMLFDLAADPMEVRDLLASGAAQPRAAQLRTLLVDAWARSGSVPWSSPPAK